MVLLLLFISLGLNCRNTSNLGQCNSVSESHYFESECNLGLLGCNAGGNECCRFCEFGDYSNVTCPESPPAPPLRPPEPPQIPSPPRPPVPSPPPSPPKPCGKVILGHCDSLSEPNIFDTDCSWGHDIYGGLGCNAGGLKCCRFCGFGVYSNISCFPSPSPPPLPPRTPMIIEPIDVTLNTKKSKIEFGIRIKESIETFDKPRFKRKLRKVLKRVPKEDIILRIRPGSVVVDVVLLVNESVIDNTARLITNMNETTLSEALNVTVIQVSPPVTTISDPVEEQNPLEYLAFPLFMLGVFTFCCGNILYCYYYPKVKRFIRNKQAVHTKIEFIETKELCDPDFRQHV